MTNESAVLGLLADLYRQITALRVENQQLRAEVARATEPADGKSSPLT